MSNKRELLYHLKKVQNLTSAVPYKSQKSKKKSKKSGLKNKNKNQYADDELDEPNFNFMHKKYQKDSDMDFFFSLFDREQEFKRQMGKLKEQIYFIRWCHSYELKVLNRKHPKYYYNPNILSYVDQFHSTYQEPSIQLKNPPKISQLPLAVSSSETIADAVKRVSKAHRKSLREKEIQIEKEKKMMIQYEYPAQNEKQNTYQAANTNLDETQNYDEELLKFTSQLLSNRAKSIKKRQSNADQSNSKYSNVSKYSYQRAMSSINNDDASAASSVESANSKLNNTKKNKSKGPIKNNLKVSAPFELHTKRRKKSKSPSIIDATANSASSTSKTNSKLKLDNISSVDISSDTNSQKTDIKKDGLFDFDPFSLKIEKPGNTYSQSSISSESNQQNQKLKIMKIDQSIISIKPEKLQFVNLSDQDLSLPPVAQKPNAKLFQFSNNDNISVPPLQSQTSSQEQSQVSYQLNSASSSVKSNIKSKNEDTSFPKDLLDQETTSSQIDTNSETDHAIKQNNIINQTNNYILSQKNKAKVALNDPNDQSIKINISKNNKSNIDDDSSDLDFDLSELKLPKSIKSNINTTDNNIDQFNFLPESLLFDKNNKNDLSDLDKNLNNDTKNKDSPKVPFFNSDSNIEISSNNSNKDINSSDKTETQQFLDQKSSSISIKRESIFSKISDIINNESIIEEEEEYDDEDQTEIKKIGSEIIKNQSNLKKQINDGTQSSDDEIKFNSQEENSSKVQISFDDRTHIDSKEKSKKAGNSHSIHDEEKDDEIKLEVNLREGNNKKNDDFNLKDILPLSILNEIMQNSSNSENEKINNSDYLFTSDEEKTIQSYMSNDDENDKKNVQGLYKEQGSQIDANDILSKNDNESESSNPDTPPNTKNANNQKSSPLSLSSGYDDDDDSSSESFIDKLKKIFPNVDLD